MGGGVSISESKFSELLQVLMLPVDFSLDENFRFIPDIFC